jgi:hypothetical protein
MLRLATPEGWWLITHPDHAHLAGDFASSWGNDHFAPPEPRRPSLHGIYEHDEGWRDRDAAPSITREGRPAAFSTELVGKYSAFEDIDLEAYLAVRRNAVLTIADEDPYAAILISMHTYNLLSARADRSTIRSEQLPLLDRFLESQQALQADLIDQLLDAGELPTNQLTPEALTANFRLLQATDNLSLLSCVDFAAPATLLHPLLLRDGTSTEVNVQRTAERTFRLTPYPLREPTMRFTLPARFVPGTTFRTSEELSDKLSDAGLQTLEVTITA